MNGWHAVVPIKSATERKTRLRGHLTQHEITALTDHLLHHVLDMLTACPAIDRITVLSPRPLEGRSGGWFHDPGTGLNAALTDVARAYPKRMIVLHADLPGLHPDDVTALIETARLHGTAIAPDRHRAGTNGLAMTNARDMVFHFGVASLLRHGAELSSDCHLHRDGLAIDIDLPEDIRLAARKGLLPASILDRLSTLTSVN